MFIIGETSKYTADYARKYSELEAYCKYEDVSLMEITKTYKKKSLIDRIMKIFF